MSENNEESIYENKQRSEDNAQKINENKEKLAIDDVDDDISKRYLTKVCLWICY